MHPTWPRGSVSARHGPRRPERSDDAVRHLVNSGWARFIGHMTDSSAPLPAEASGPARIAKGAFWSGTVVFALVAAGRGDVMVAFCALSAMVLALLPRGFTLISGVRMPSGLATGVLVFSLAALVAGEMGGLYATTAWWDVALHLVAAAALAVLGMALALLPTAGASPRTAIWLLATLAFSFAMMVGAMWELLEFTIDFFFGTHAQRSGLPDTMGDIFANLVGATYGALAAHVYLTHGRRWPLSGLLAQFCALNPVFYGDWRGPPLSKR